MDLKSLSRPPQSGPITIACCAVLVTIVSGLFGPLPSLQAQPSRQSVRPTETTAPDPLETYLKHLGLDELLAVHLEERFRTVTNATEKELLGSRLVQLHAARLRSGTLDDAELQVSLSQLDALLTEVAQLRTADLESVLLQAHHQQAYRQAIAWWERSDDATLKQSARAALSDLEPRFAQFLEQQKESEDQLQDKMDSEEQENRVEALSAQLSEIRTASLRVLFYAAWNDLYSATTASAAEQAAELDRSRARFSEFLSFDAERDGESIDAESMELEIPLRARAALGLAITLLLLDQTESANRWLAALGDDRVVAEVRTERYGEILLFLTVSGRYSQALSIASPLVDQLQAPAQVPDVRWARTLARQGEIATLTGSPDATNLRSLGYEALVRLRQFTLCDRILEEFSTQPPAATNAWLGWLVGHRALAAAELTNQVADYQAAAVLLTKARELPGARSDVSSLGRLTLESGWAHHKGEEFEIAAKEFEQAIPLLKPRDRDLAVEAAWMRALALQQLSQTDKERVRDAVDAFQRLVLEFADHPKATEARYQIARLQRTSGDSSRSLASLEAIPSTDPNYVLARFELVGLRFEAWKAATEPPAKETAYQQLINEVRKFGSIAAGESGGEQRLRAQLLAAEASLTMKQTEAGVNWLEQSAPLIGAQPADSASVAQWHYLKLTVAQQTSQPADLVREAQWLADNARVGSYRQAGLVHLTRDLEARWQAGDAAQRAAISIQSVERYRDLSSLLGDDPETIRNNRNARVALQRLAFHLAASNHSTDAAEAYDRLVAAFPDDATALRGLGMTRYTNGEWDAALEPWGKLVTGLNSGSEGWYEARYHELDCLRRIRPDDAQKIWKQFRLLHPDIPFETWRSRFEQLATVLGD